MLSEIRVNIYYPLMLLQSLSPPSTTLTVTAQYKGELFIGVILHPLETTDNDIIKALHMILF